jgi:hypothetical protein
LPDIPFAPCFSLQPSVSSLQSAFEGCRLLIAGYCLLPIAYCLKKSAAKQL